jgi:thiamine biosynthesis lipoprotein
MKTIGRKMDRRAFLKVPALLPLTTLRSAFRTEEHHFQYEGVIGTSMDLVVSTPSFYLADCVCQTILEEIDRLASILNTRDPASEISMFQTTGNSRRPSRELKEVLDAYAYWERRTDGVFSIRPEGSNGSRNVDALGKAYIIDRAVKVARKAWPSVNALMLNIGGDIVVSGRPCEIEIADPLAAYENATPISTILVHNAAVATSGTYARGAHLKDARSGQCPADPTAATVAALDAVTANALATTLCVTSADHGFRLVESTRGAAALRFASAAIHRTSGFSLLERPSVAQEQTPTKWPAGYRVTITLPLSSGRSRKRPYVAVWVQDSSNKLVRSLALWGTSSKYYPDLSTAWSFLKTKSNTFRAVTRATRPAGKYELLWDGLDDAHNPLPLGAYRITVETNQEHGTYAKQTGTITLGESPTSITLPATSNFDSVMIQYGPA